jgi:hypothetical protein
VSRKEAYREPDAFIEGMAHYLVRAIPRQGALKRIWKDLKSGRIASMRPFGRALDESLRNARFDLRGHAVWEEEDYCSPPLAMEREAVLDEAFEPVSVEPVRKGSGWAAIKVLPSLWIFVFGFPQRRGERPVTRRGMPHQQLTQNPGPKIYSMLAEELFSLPDVTEEVSAVSVPGARALVLDDEAAEGPEDAFMYGREFAHLHPPGDGSLHLMAPPNWVDELVSKGWAEPHPAAGRLIPRNAVMVYAPRDEAEVRTVMEVVLLSYWRAKGANVPGPKSLA